MLQSRLNNHRVSSVFLFAAFMLLFPTLSETQFATDSNGNLVFTGGNVSIGAPAVRTMKLRIRTTDTKFGLFLQNFSTSNLDTFGLRAAMGGRGNGTKFGIFSRVVRPQDFAAYFQGKVFFRDSVGVGIESPQAQLDLADVFAAGGMNLRIGNDAFFTDIDRANTLGLFGNQDSSTASLQLGNGGPVLTGKQGHLGLGADSPQAQLDLGDIFAAGGMNLRIGNDAFFTDIDRANTLGLFGNQDDTIAAIQLGMSGPVLWGKNGKLGLVTSEPEAHLHVARSSAILGEDLVFGSDGDLKWLQSSNPSTKADLAVAVATDGGTVYVAGTGASSKWRIEMRRKDTGALLSAVESNNKGAAVTGIAIDDKAVYTVGHNDSGQIVDSVWVIEKRNKGTGAVAWVKTSNPSPNISNSIHDDRAFAIAVDETGVYVAGGNPGPGIHAQRVEKRNKDTGNLVLSFNNTGIVETAASGGSAEVSALAIDATGLYVVGSEAPSGIQIWTIRKLDRLTGSQIWAKVSPLPGSLRREFPRDIIVDAGALYVAGSEPAAGFNDAAWRVEKRAAQTGDLIAGFGTAGILTVNASNDVDIAKGLGVDATGLYVVGVTDSRWRIEKRHKNTGALRTAFGQSGVITRNPATDATSAVADASGLYVVGSEKPGGNVQQWRMEKLEGQVNEFKGLVVTPPGNVGIGIKDPQRILTVRKDSATDPIADRWETYSSRRWKADIRPLPGALETVRKLRGVSYHWKTTGQSDIGMIAEEVAQILPEIVSFEEDGVNAMGLDYGRLVPVLIEAVKQQQLQIDALMSLFCADKPRAELCR